MSFYTISTGFNGTRLIYYDSTLVNIQKNKKIATMYGVMSLLIHSKNPVIDDLLLHLFR